MPRVTLVRKARKDQGRCGKCGDEIKAGDGYRHWSFRYGGKHIRCLKPACAPRRSDLTQSKMGYVYAAVESAEEAIDTAASVGDLCDALGDAHNEIFEVAQDYRDSADAQRDYFPESSTADESEEKAEELEIFAFRLGDLINDFSGLMPDVEAGEDYEEMLEGLKEEAQDELGECPY